MVCIGMDVTDGFEAYNDFSVYKDNCTKCVAQEHDISLLGYGIDDESGEKYWIGRNSWGTFWGEYGYFRIIRGQNNLGIEIACAWATPSDKPTWVNKSSNINNYKQRGGGAILNERDMDINYGFNNKYRMYADVILPDTFTWSNYNGTNLLTILRNQHIPSMLYYIHICTVYYNSYLYYVCFYGEYIVFD